MWAGGGVLGWFKGHSYYGVCLTFCFEVYLLICLRTRKISWKIAFFIVHPDTIVTPNLELRF